LEAAFPDEKGQRNTAILYDLSVQMDAFERICVQKAEEAKKRSFLKDVPRYTEGTLNVTVDEPYAREVLKKRAERKNTHILLVEDDAFTLSLVEQVLKNYVVIKTMDGGDALETYMLNAPDVVFLDINLPHVNGHEILKAILAFDPAAFVVMLSGNSYKEDVAKAIQNGAKGFVTKPFPKEKLMSYVKNYEEKRGRSS